MITGVLRGERAGDGDALALAGREQIGEPVGMLREPDGDEGVDRALVRVDPLDAADREPELDVLAGGEEAGEPRRLADERDRVAAEARPGIAIERRHRPAADQHLALVRNVEPARRARAASTCRSRTGPVTTDSRPGANVARDVVERDVLPVAARHTAQLDERSGRSLDVGEHRHGGACEAPSGPQLDDPVARASPSPGRRSRHRAAPPPGSASSRHAR